MEEAEHQRFLPAESTKKTLPMVFGRLTFFVLVVVVVVPIGATEPALVSVDGVPVEVSFVDVGGVLLDVGGGLQRGAVVLQPVGGDALGGGGADALGRLHVRCGLRGARQRGAEQRRGGQPAADGGEGVLDLQGEYSLLVAGTPGAFGASVRQEGIPLGPAFMPRYVGI
ncbi:hypothetical protein [Nonomuraea sp. JJY05]|uniref:hypothetical protein n=1 Tax=Nonomuraea sp. JJY05 TaxID=3350255 RepID=UPI00373EB48D